MSRFTVTLCRVEHHAYQLEVEAATPEEAHEIAVETWDDDDESFDHLGVVHAEDFIEDIKKKTEAA
jgi:hypothetical protein